MLTRLRCAAVVAAALAVATPAAAFAQNVVWWTDYTVGGNGSITGALAARPGLTVTAASSQGDFNTQLTSGTFDLAIFGEQGGYVFGSSASAMSTFIAGGGKVLAASWTQNGSGFASFFGTAVTSANQSTISGSGPMFVGGPSSPFTLTNPGWGVYSEGYSGSGPCLATFADASCAAQSALGGDALLLGGLFDTYNPQSDGVDFVGNGIDYLLGSDVVATPEPASVALLATGLIGIGGVVRRRKVQRS